MHTDVSLKVERVRNNNKFHQILSINILNTLMPKIPKWLVKFLVNFQDILQ